MAQYRPDSATLLAAVADVLDEALDTVPVDQRHRVRVAAHLVRLVERDERLGAAAAAHEVAALSALLGEPFTDRQVAVEQLAERIRASRDPSFERRVWDVLVDVTRRDLEIVKPGHADWTGP